MISIQEYWGEIPSNDHSFKEWVQDDKNSIVSCIDFILGEVEPEEIIIRWFYKKMQKNWFYSLSPNEQNSVLDYYKSLLEWWHREIWSKIFKFETGYWEKICNTLDWVLHTNQTPLQQ